MNKLKKKEFLIPLIIAVISSIFLAVTNISDVTSKPYENFIQDISNKNISKVYMPNSNLITVELKDGSKYKTDNPKSLDLKEKILLSGAQVLEKSPVAPIQIIPSVTLGLSLLTILIMFVKSSSITSKGLASVDSLAIEGAANNKYNFEKVAGNEEAKESVKDIVDFLKNPEKYRAYGARMPKGVILYGEPGTGKTLLAKAVAGEAGVPFYSMSGSDFIQVYVGVGASRIRSLFKKAKNHGKAVIFIDEIDAIGKMRDSNKAGSSDERDQTLNALLTEMSGFSDSEGIVVMAATNRLDMLDPALLRPGRFDRHIEVNLPDIKAREQILELHLKDKPTENIDIHSLAQKTAYFSGAKLESLVNEAAILACKDNSDFIKESHIDKAYSITIAGYEKINKEGMKDSDRKVTAYHEAGHALISTLMLPQEKVSKVTIIPSTKGAGGYTLSIPEDKMYQTMDYLKNRVMVLLAGRAAEEIIFGKTAITTGAYSDLKHSTDIVLKMVTQYGMGKTLGLLNIEQLSILKDNNSEEVIQECKDIVDNLYLETKDLLINNIDKLHNISKELLERETLIYEDLISIVNNDDKKSA